jgi:hypothetical protein
MVADTIQNAIDALHQQSQLIDRLYSDDAEGADAAQRKAHQSIRELKELKRKAESGTLIEQALAA